MKDQRCGSCSSVNVTELATETCLHFTGLSGLNVEPIFLFPRAVVCLDCGSMQSNLAEKEIEQVKKAAAKFDIAVVRHRGSSLL